MVLPTVISYFTENTGYEEEVKGLIASCKAHNLPTSIDPIPHFGSWEKNCCFKPSYILKKLEELNRPLLWLDADAIAFKRPTLFETMKEDIGVRIVDHLPDDHPSKVISGTIFINNTTGARRLLHEWIEETQKNLLKDPHHWDQVSLRNVIQKNQATIYPLDHRYYQVYTSIEDSVTLDESVIIHFQASRTLKKTLNQEVVSFWNEAHHIEQKKSMLLSSILPDCPI
ncbi:MAG: hypothetical protein KDK60_03305 [Chlamydiia bacterium]|nr:hypothetical protein [Chlamydiia bacterium]